MNLPPDIKQLFFETIIGDMSVLQFEEWLYTNKELESILSAEDYLALISYGYKGERRKHGLDDLLIKHVDQGEYQKFKLLRLLGKALQRDKELPDMLYYFYELYCDGYTFLDNIGLSYGLSFDSYPSSYGVDNYEELSERKKNEILNSFYPQLDIEIKKVINWLETGTVVPLGQNNEGDNLQFLDHRTEEDKRPTSYTVDTSDQYKKRQWWKFWK